MTKSTLQAVGGDPGSEIGAEAKAIDQDNGAEASAPDPFDLASLRLDQSFVETAGVKKLLTTVPVEKPKAQSFVRVHPDPQYRDTFAMIEMKDDREFYLLPPTIARELPGEFIMNTLYTAITRQDVIFLWPVRVPDADGKTLEWHRSMGEAAEMAVSRWVRVKANKALGAYEIHEAQGITAEPKWPDVTFKELLRIAFRNRLVDSLNHAVVRQLRGLV